MDVHSSDVSALVARVAALERASTRLERVWTVGALSQHSLLPASSSIWKNPAERKPDG